MWINLRLFWLRHFPLFRTSKWVALPDQGCEHPLHGTQEILRLAKSLRDVIDLFVLTFYLLPQESVGVAKKAILGFEHRDAVCRSLLRPAGACCISVYFKPFFRDVGG